MSLPKGLDFREYHVEGCCGMVELANLMKKSSSVSWKEAAKTLTEWLDTHGLMSDNADDIYDYVKKKYVKRAVDKQDWNYGRRLIITSIRNGQKDLIEGLCEAGWHALTEFPGNHGLYKLTLLGYTPKSPNNKNWFGGLHTDDEDDGRDEGWGDDGDEEEYGDDY